MTNDHNTRVFFSDIAQRLLSGGIAPRHTKRIVSELKDHYEDLREQAIETGASPEEAAREAISKLGREDDLVAEALSRPELRTWSSRWPWAIYGIVPALSVFFGTILICLITTVLAGGMKDPNIPILAKQSVEAGFFIAQYIFPLAIVVFVCHQSVQRRDALSWTLIGLALLCFISAGFHVHFRWPNEELQGFVSVSLTYLTPFPGKVVTAIKCLINASFVAACLLWFRSRMAKALAL